MDTFTPNSGADTSLAPRPDWLQSPQLRERLQHHDVVLLGGGTSEEREVSLQSAAAMAAALEGLQGTPETACLKSLRKVEIDARGAWVVDGQAFSRSQAMQQLEPGSLFFLALHGGEGENGQIQEFLGEQGALFTGSGAESSALCMDKQRACTRVQEAGIDCAPGLKLTQSNWQDPLSLKDCRDLGPGPWFVKPNCGGSSVGIVRAADPRSLHAAIELILESGREVLVEQEVKGLEVSVGVLGSAGSSAQALPMCEILPAPGHFFDYTEKYDDTGATEHCPPVHSSPAVAAHVQRLACQAFAALGCNGYARVDFILREADGVPVFLEANTLPGMTERSLLPLAARAAGMDLGSLCVEILARALPRPAPSTQP